MINVKKHLKYVVGVCIFIILIQLISYAFNDNLPRRDTVANYKVISEKYEYLYRDQSNSIESLIDEGIYEGKTIVALSVLRSNRYRFDLAETSMHFDTVNLYGYEKSTIIDELDRIYNEMEKKVTVVSFLMSIEIYLITLLISGFILLILWIIDRNKNKDSISNI